MRTLVVLLALGMLVTSLPSASASGPEAPHTISCGSTVSQIIQCVVTITVNVINYGVGVVQYEIQYANGRVQCVISAPPGAYPGALTACVPPIV